MEIVYPKDYSYPEISKELAKDIKEAYEDAKKEKAKENKSCSYYSCKEETRLLDCPYCQEYFCKDHIKPKPAGNRKDYSKNKYIAQKFIKELHKKRGHPCLPYTPIWLRKIEELPTDFPIDNPASPTEVIPEPINEPSKQKRRGLFKKVSNWLISRSCSPYNYDIRMNYVTNLLLLFSIALLSLNILYPNLIKLNNLNVIYIFQIGGAIYLLVIILFIYLLYSIISELINWGKRQKHWIIYSILVGIIILSLITLSYGGINIFNPVVKYYEETDFNQVSPINLGFERPEYRLPKEMSDLSNYALQQINDIRGKNNIVPIEKDRKSYQFAVFLTKEHAKENSHYAKWSNFTPAFKLGDNVSILVGFPLAYSGKDTMDKEAINSFIEGWSINPIEKNIILNPEYNTGGLACFGSTCALVVSTTPKPVSTNSYYSDLSSNKDTSLNDISLPNAEDDTDKSDFFYTPPEREEECKETFEKLNEIRINYGKKQISWDNRAYELAVDRSKDMQENNYMDHTSPTGQCPENMKTSYGFKSNEYLAENAGGMSYYSRGNVAGNCDEALDSWLSSRGHRYNLLYDDHNSGAIGCYYEICVFLGVHNDFYGLGGGGECYTAAEGSAYWNMAGVQPGEV